jgi:hypothetical protein
MACDFPSPETFVAVERTSLAFEIELLEVAARGARDNMDVLVRLGELYSRAGRIREGLAVDLRLVTLAPQDPIVLYNLACSFALWGKAETALRTLELALGCGYDDDGHLLRDPDLISVRALPEFEDYLARVRANTPQRHWRNSTIPTIASTAPAANTVTDNKRCRIVTAPASIFASAGAPASWAGTARAKSPHFGQKKSASGTNSEHVTHGFTGSSPATVAVAAPQTEQVS